MKLLLVHPGPHFSVSDIHDGLLRGFTGLGCDARTFNLHDRLTFYQSAGRMDADGQFVPMVDEAGAVRFASKGLEAVCFEWWPDILIVVSCFFVPYDTLDIIRARGIKVVIVHTESPYEDDRQISRAVHADLNVVNDPTNLHRFQDVGPAFYMPHAYDPAVHHPGPISDPGHRSDFCFVGTAYPSRVAFLETVDWTGIDVAFGGNWDHVDPTSPLLAFMAHDKAECLDNTSTADLYRATKASVNLYRTEGEIGSTPGWSMGPREVELAAIGRFFLREPRGEGDTVLPMIPTFVGPDDFEDKLRWWLDHPAQRADVEFHARTAIQDRTFTANAKAILSAVAG